MEFALALLVLIAIVTLFVVAPLRRDDEAVEAADDRRAELEAAKEAKYREIRDAEMDFRMGKVSEADFRATDRELRGQAIEILRRLDALEGREAGEASPPADDAARR